MAVEVQFAPGASLAGLTPQARAMWDKIVEAADSAGLAVVRFNAGQATEGHVSHMHGTELDMLAYNADGSTWTVRQRLAVAEAAATVGGNRFGFYTRPDRPVSILHVGVGYEGGQHNAAWGPNGLTSGVGVNQFYPEEQAFVAAVRNGQVTSGEYTPMAYTAEATLPEAFNQIFATAPNLNALIQRGGMLSPGMQGDAVRELQEFLNNEGFTDDAGRTLGTDGKFGRRTLEALRSYQRGNEIPADGVVGPQTFALMFERVTDAPAPEIIPPVAPPSPSTIHDRVLGGNYIRPGDNGDEVRQLQEFLNYVGAGPVGGIAVDGDFGPQTRNALRSYQRINGLNPDGIVGPQTADMIQIDWMRNTPPQVTVDPEYQAGDDRQFARNIAAGVDPAGIVAGLPNVSIRMPGWGGPAPGWRRLTEQDIRPVPTQLEWTVRPTPGPVDPNEVPDTTYEDTYYPTVDNSPSPQPDARRQSVPAGVQPPDFARMSLNELAEWRNRQLSQWRPGMPTPVEPPEFTLAYNFRREEALGQVTAAERMAAVEYRAANGTNPRVAPPAPYVERSIGEGEYLPHEQILIRQLNSNLNSAPKAVISPQLSLGGSLRRTPGPVAPPAPAPDSVVRRTPVTLKVSAPVIKVVAPVSMAVITKSPKMLPTR